MKIRKAEFKDLLGIISIWWEMQSHHLKYDSIFYKTQSEQTSKEMAKKYFEISLENKNHTIIVVEESEKIIGMLHCEISDRPPVYEVRKKAVILETVVAEGFRGQGHFMKMFEALKNELRSRDIKFCFLSVEKDNDSAIRAYSKCNFKERQKFMVCKL